MFKEEQNVLPVTKATSNVFDGINKCNHTILFVNDGSSDSTLEKIKDLSAEQTQISFISSSKKSVKEQHFKMALLTQHPRLMLSYNNQKI